MLGRRCHEVDASPVALALMDLLYTIIAVPDLGSRPLPRNNSRRFSKANLRRRESLGLVMKEQKEYTNCHCHGKKLDGISIKKEKGKILCE